MATAMRAAAIVLRDSAHVVWTGEIPFTGDNCDQANVACTEAGLEAGDWEAAYAGKIPRCHGWLARAGATMREIPALIIEVPWLVWEGTVADAAGESRREWIRLSGTCDRGHPMTPAHIRLGECPECELEFESTCDADEEGLIDSFYEAASLDEVLSLVLCVPAGETSAELDAALSYLPTFGGDEPADTAGIFSWDEGRFLVQVPDSRRWAIIDREERPC